MLSDKYMITARYSTVSKSIHHDYREKVQGEMKLFFIYSND